MVIFSGLKVITIRSIVVLKQRFFVSYYKILRTSKTSIYIDQVSEIERPGIDLTIG